MREPGAPVTGEEAQRIAQDQPYLVRIWATLERGVDALERIAATQEAAQSVQRSIAHLLSVAETEDAAPIRLFEDYREADSAGWEVLLENRWQPANAAETQVFDARLRERMARRG
jgi:hypothetical protein